MWDDSVNHAICINGFALNNPVCIGSSSFRTRTQKRRSESSLGHRCIGKDTYSCRSSRH